MLENLGGLYQLKIISLLSVAYPVVYPALFLGAAAYSFWEIPSDSAWTALAKIPASAFVGLATVKAVKMSNLFNVIGYVAGHIAGNILGKGLAATFMSHAKPKDQTYNAAISTFGLGIMGGVYMLAMVATDGYGAAAQFVTKDILGIERQTTSLSYAAARGVVDVIKPVIGLRP